MCQSMPLDLGKRKVDSYIKGLIIIYKWPVDNIQHTIAATFC